MQKPDRYTWKLEEREEDGEYVLLLRIISLDDDQGGNNDNPDDNPDDGNRMGAYYDDGINDATDKTSLRTYADDNHKYIGTAISTWKNDITNANLAETKEVAAQFNMLVAENEMKFDALQPSRNQFNYWAADNLVNFAQRNGMVMRGHCLAWHSQLPEWVSSDGKKNDKNWSRAVALQRTYGCFHCDCSRYHQPIWYSGIDYRHADGWFLSDWIWIVALGYHHQVYSLPHYRGIHEWYSRYDFHHSDKGLIGNADNRCAE